MIQGKEAERVFDSKYGPICKKIDLALAQHAMPQWRGVGNLHMLVKQIWIPFVRPSNRKIALPLKTKPSTLPLRHLRTRHNDRSDNIWISTNYRDKTTTWQSVVMNLGGHLEFSTLSQARNYPPPTLFAIAMWFMSFVWSKWQCVWLAKLRHVPFLKFEMQTTSVDRKQNKNASGWIISFCWIF